MRTLLASLLLLTVAPQQAASTLGDGGSAAPGVSTTQTSALCIGPHLKVGEVIDGDASIVACQTLIAEEAEILSGNVLFVAGSSITLAGPFSVAEAPHFEAAIDPCVLAPAGLNELADSEALTWIATAAQDPAQSLTLEPFASASPADYPDLWFLGDVDFAPDEGGDLFLRLTGAPAAGAEVQTLEPISPVAEQRIRAWFRFRHPTAAQTTDSTLGLERFDLDLAGGFLACDEEPACATSACLADCEAARACHPDSDPDPCAEECRASCTPDVATDKAHFALLLDLDQKPLTAVFADGSPCGHLPCSPWTAQSVFVEQTSSIDPLSWHLLFIEYRPDTPAGAAFCLDGARLEDEAISSSVSVLAGLLRQATRPLRLRVSANVEMPDTEQIVELDWFALQGHL